MALLVKTYREKEGEHSDRRDVYFRHVSVPCCTHSDGNVPNKDATHDCYRRHGIQDHPKYQRHSIGLNESWSARHGGRILFHIDRICPIIGFHMIEQCGGGTVGVASQPGHLDIRHLFFQDVVVHDVGKSDTVIRNEENISPSEKRSRGLKRKSCNAVKQEGELQKCPSTYNLCTHLYL